MVHIAPLFFRRQPFDSTYKELKHFLFAFDCKVKTTFDSTYKELKRDRMVQVLEYADTFDSTYKELKLVYVSLILLSKIFF